MEPLNQQKIKAELYKARLLLKCQVDEKTGCWIWLGTGDRYGQGLIKVDGVRVSVARLAWALWKKEPLAADQRAKRTCRNARCFNPDHIQAFRVNLRGGANVLSE